MSNEREKRSLLDGVRENAFLFTELVKRDFKKKYKRTYLGMLWSVLSPLLTLLVMSLVFTNFFGSHIEKYPIYLFCGNIVFSFFTDATNGGMGSLMGNADIFSKVNVPKYLFLLSRVVTSIINFGLTFIVFLIFCIIFKVEFTLYFLALVIPIACLIIFNIGMGLILSALFVFFRDIQYLWSVFTLLLMYVSAIFYDVEQFGDMKILFNLNPIFVYIKYIRQLVLYQEFPSVWLNLAAVGYALVALGIGALIYKAKNHKFLYYI
jgi:ABC-2 type transport system permease protein